MRKLVALACLGLLLTGCAASAQTPDSATEAPIVQAPESDPEPAPPAKLVLPDGYPQVVPITDLPEHMQWAFEKTGTGQAVAVAPGVWAELAPGATAEDAVRAGAFSGFCSSLEAFERDYLNGESAPGMCW